MDAFFGTSPKHARGDLRLSHTSTNSANEFVCELTFVARGLRFAKRVRMRHLQQGRIDAKLRYRS